jgi:large subunit ribosomal protein L19
MINQDLASFEQAQIQKLSQGKRIDNFKTGDTIKVGLVIREGTGSRVQYLQGIVIALKFEKNRLNATFTVRKINSGGVGFSAERVLFYHSPNIDSIERVSEGLVRRSKIYYLRKKFGKRAKVPVKRVKKQKEISQNNA